MCDFIDALIRCAQNGYENDVVPMLGLCRETWNEEQLWDAIKDVSITGKTRLMYHASTGNLERIKWLIKRGAETKKIDNNSRTCLMWACVGGNLKVIRFLVEEMKMDTNLKDNNGMTCFHYACNYGHYDIVKYLYDKCDPNIASIDNNYPIHCAIQHIDIIKFLIEKLESSVKLISNDGGLLHKACYFEIYHVIDYLLTQNINIDAVDNGNETALYLATERGNIRIMEKLLDKGANPDIGSIFTGCTPLLSAINTENIEAVNLLLEFDAKHHCDLVTGSSPLHWACSVGNIQIIKNLINNGADLSAIDMAGQTPIFGCLNNPKAIEYLTSTKYDFSNDRNQFGNTPLLEAISANEYETVKILTHRTNPYLVNNSGQNALHLACMNHNSELVVTLLKLKVHVNAITNRLFYTPLMYACMNGLYDIASLLILADANLEYKSSSGNTCLFWACSGGHDKIVRLILNFNNSIRDEKNLNHGHTPLMISSIKGHYNCVKELVLAGADVHAKTEFGVTALYFACWKNKINVVDFLLNNSANPNDVDNDGTSCLMVASEFGNKEIIIKLLERGAYKYLSNYDGLQALDYANDIEIENLLS